MKKFLIAILIITSIFAFAKTKEISIKAKEVELVFNDVQLKNLEFGTNSKIIIGSKKLDNIDIKTEKDRITISGEDNKIDLTLPESKKYICKFEDGVMKFDSKKVTIESNDGEIVRFEDGNLLILDDDGKTKVEINSEGIFVEEGDDKVEIGSEGIIVESEEENKNLTGFWGQLLGGFIRVVAKGSLSIVGKTPEKIVKHIINDDDNSISFGDNDWKKWNDSDNDKITKEMNSTFEGKEGTILNVTNSNGSIKIIGWAKDFIDINTTLITSEDEEEFEKVEIEVKEKNKACNISTVYKSKKAKVSVEYLIKLPFNMKIGEIQSSNGSIKIDGVNGNADISSSNGSLKIDNSKGEISLRTSNGSITVDNFSGSVDARTSNGRINISKVNGSIDASTSNGSISAEISSLKEDADFSTSNGSIKLYLNPKLDAEIYASTTNSHIKLNDIEIKTSELSKNYLKGKIGKGGNLIKATTTNSSINIYELKKTKNDAD